VRLCIAELCEALLLTLVRLLLPARGRHRAATPTSRSLPLPAYTARPLLVEALVMDTRLVRPYLHTLEVHA
jgi:hypothetical protein